LHHDTHPCHVSHRYASVKSIEEEEQEEEEEEEQQQQHLQANMNVNRAKFQISLKIWFANVHLLDLNDAHNAFW